MISHVELLLLLYFLTTSGEIWSWRQAEKCDLHIHKKQPHKVGKFATCKFYLLLSLFSHSSWRPVLQLPGPEKATVAVRCCPVLFELLPKLTSESESEPPLFKWGLMSGAKMQGTVITEIGFFFVYTACSIAWYMQWQVSILFSCTTHNTVLPSGLSPIFTTLGSLTSHGTCI